MPEQNGEVRRIEWRSALPALRLFNTTHRALHFQQMTLALGCVLACYLAGRLLDGLWGSNGVIVAIDSGARHEIDAFASLSGPGFKDWKRETLRQQRESARQAALNHADGTREETETRLRTERPERLLSGGTFVQQRNAARAFIEQRLSDTLAALKSDAQRSADDKRETSARLKAAADTLKRHLAGKAPARAANAEQANALHTILSVTPTADEAAAGKLRQAIARADAIAAVTTLRPQGIFITLLTYEMDCFAAAVQGALRGSWGYAGMAYSREPSMLGSIGSAASGILWLATERPLYAALYGVVHLAIFCFFGLAICRSAAIQGARGESTTLSDMLVFAREKAPGCILALLTPVALALVVVLLLFVGGLVGAIPWIGTVVATLLYFLAILGGGAVAGIVILGVLGIHLIAPRIAIEGSDGFDGGQYAVSYATSRGWHLALYALFLLIYGAASFIVMRVILLLTLKFAHVFTAAGMSGLGAWSSGETATVGRLDAMWRMPTWGELSLLPSVGGTPFWGEFAAAPLSTPEMLGCLLLRFWVFLLVGLLGAFVVSFYFVGSTNMYLLLRKSCDGVEYEELYYEEVDDSFSEAPEPPSEAGKGTAPLPVISPRT